MPLELKERAGHRLSHQDQVLAMLKLAGKAGCTSEELTLVTWRFSGRIFDLRKKGFNIVTQERPGSDSALFILLPTVNQVDQPSMLVQPAPARPSSGLVTGICSCHHPRAWHALASGACNSCTCQHYVSEE